MVSENDLWEGESFDSEQEVLISGKVNVLISGKVILVSAYTSKYASQSRHKFQLGKSIF